MSDAGMAVKLPIEHDDMAKKFISELKEAGAPPKLTQANYSGGLAEFVIVAFHWTPVMIESPKRPVEWGALPSWWAHKRFLSRPRLYQCQRRKITLALTPPNPKPFDIACSMGIGLAASATRSTPSAAASLFSRVGGATWSRSARIVKIASTPPAAPSRCPVDGRGTYSRRPKRPC